MTSFCTPWGLFEYVVMPFGLANSPASFQCFISSVLSEYLVVFCFVYIDDILIVSRDVSSDIQHLKLVLSKPQSHRLVVSPEKSFFFSI